MKTCGRCNTEKPASEFHSRKASKDGLAATCKVCVKEYGKSRYSENKPRYQELNAAWRQANMERKREVDRAYKQSNRDKIHQQERNRLHIRRARIKNAVAEDPRLSKAEQIIFGFYGRECLVPDCKSTDASLDHVVPFALGGRHEFSNLQVLCRFHNCSKQHRNSTDYRTKVISECEITKRWLS